MPESIPPKIPANIPTAECKNVKGKANRNNPARSNKDAIISRFVIFSLKYILPITYDVIVVLINM